MISDAHVQRNELPHFLDENESLQKVFSYFYLTETLSNVLKI